MSIAWKMENGVPSCYSIIIASIVFFCKVPSPVPRIGRFYGLVCNPTSCQVAIGTEMNVCSLTRKEEEEEDAPREKGT